MPAAKVLAACMMLASQTYDIPPAALVGIYKVENGAIGQEVLNTNGSYDLGPMQINTVWLPELADKWGVKEETAHKWVRDDACTNIGVAAWILKGHINKTGSLSKAIGYYHSKTTKYNTVYKKKVLSALKKDGLIRTHY